MNESIHLERTRLAPFPNDTERRRFRVPVGQYRGMLPKPPNHVERFAALDSEIKGWQKDEADALAAKANLIAYLQGAYPRGWMVDGTRYTWCAETADDSGIPVVSHAELEKYHAAAAKHRDAFPPRAAWKFQPHHRGLSVAEIVAAIRRDTEDE